jgi:hypothetical protein
VRLEDNRDRSWLGVVDDDDGRRAGFGELGDENRQMVGESLPAGRYEGRKTRAYIVFMENISHHHAELSDTELVSEARRLAVDEHEATVRLVSLLAVLDERRCYLAEGYGSTFGFCVRVLGLSEYAAFHRIKAARTVRRFPAVLERFASGALTLEAVRLLTPHLTFENHVGLLDAAAGKSKRGIEKLLAVLFPRPDVPAKVRKLPARRADAVASADEAGVRAFPPPASSDVYTTGFLADADESQAERREGAAVAAASRDGEPATIACSATSAAPLVLSDGRLVVRNALPNEEGRLVPLQGVTQVGITLAPSSSLDEAVAATLSATPPVPAVQCARHRAVVEPLAAERYRVQLTISGETHEKLRRAQDLLRHQVPDGDLATLFDRAITLLVSDLERKKCAMVSRPREESKSAQRRSGSKSIESRAPDTAPRGSEHSKSKLASDAGGPTSKPDADVPAKSSCDSDESPKAPPESIKDPPAGVKAPPTEPKRRGASGNGKRPATAISRHIPSHVKRRVWRRDQGRCGFFGNDGRCEETGMLEFHHVIPHAVGGEATARTIGLRCRSHNHHEAAIFFGRDHSHLIPKKPGDALPECPTGAGTSSSDAAVSSAAG